jgi:Leucine Rich repeat
MTEHVRPVSHPWRRYVRFSVRGLIVVVLVIGLVLGWIVRPARIQREAVTAIEKGGGSVIYDWEWNDGNSFGNDRPWAPRWLVDALGADYFGSVVLARCYGTGADAEVAQVGRLATLTNLSLSGRRVTDAGLAPLKGLSGLERLEIHCECVTDAGMAHLKRLTNLRELSLSGTPITNDGLAHLEGLTNLSLLALGSTQVTDAGLAHLRGLTNLSVLSLSSTQVTDSGLSRLKKLGKLSKLHLVRTQVTDAGVKQLKQALPGLTITR